MGQNIDLTVNRLPSLTWNRLGVNRAIISNIDTNGWNTADIMDEDKIKRSDMTDDMPAVLTGMGDETEKLAALCPDSAICVSSENTDGQKVRFAPASGGGLFRDLVLVARKNESLTVWTDISSKDGAKGTFFLRTRLRAAKNSHIRLVFIDMLGRDYDLMNDLGVLCEDNANVEILQMFLGGSRTWTGCRTELVGDKSKFKLDVGYLCTGEELLDMNYIANHIGKKTESTMNIKGVLKDAANKLFRGTIDFKQGSSGSRGDETEDVLILGDDVVNKTVPLILCAEEDVEGNHGATIGRLDEDVLFYMASRGLSEKEAERLVAMARLEELKNRIDDAELSGRVMEYIEEAS